jgi:hypothetical protein
MEMAMKMMSEVDKVPLTTAPANIATMSNGNR